MNFLIGAGKPWFPFVPEQNKLKKQFTTGNKCQGGFHEKYRRCDRCNPQNDRDV